MFKRQCFRRKCCRKCCCIITILLAVLVFLLVYNVSKYQCSEEESHHLISNLCDLHARGYVAGSLCQPLCDDQAIHFQRCLNYKLGKKIFLCSWNRELIILKSSKSLFEDYESLLDDIGLTQFFEIITNTLKFHFNINLHDYAKVSDISVPEIPQTFVATTWQGEFDFNDESLTKSLSRAVVRSLWSLLQQEEYITMQHFKDSSHIPNILGSCGHVYAMEYVPSGSILSQNIPSLDVFMHRQWQPRAEIALGLLDLVEEFENLDYGCLHLCDVKGDNFGMSVHDSVIKAIDLDMAFVTRKLESELSSANCSKHEDCNFFECWGWCDQIHGKCTGIRRNNNLQAVCQKIFLPHHAVSGLLSYPPISIRQQLAAVLQQCVEPSQWTNENARYRATDKTMQQLRQLLHVKWNSE